jgi:DNA/RNA endonuclease YhcR with UshA esterase domain
MKLKFILSASCVILFSLVTFSQVKIKSFDAGNYIGKKVIVTGVVVQISATKEGTYFLDIGQRFRYNEITAVISGADMSKFDNIIQLMGRTVEISGTVSGSKGQPRIILKNTVQLKVID